MPFGQRELPFERDHLQRRRGADVVPEQRLAGGRGDADARGTAVDVVRGVDRLGVARQRTDAPDLRLREQRVVSEAVLLEQRFERAGPAAESQRVDRQDRDVGVAGETFVAGRRMLAPQRFVQDHPQRVAGRNTVTAREHELVRERELGFAQVVAQPSQVGPGQVTGDVVGRIGQRPAEVARLRVIPHETQVHRGHEGDVVEPCAFVIGQFDGVRFELVRR